MQYSYDEKILIWLSSFDHLTINKAHLLLENFENPSKIYSAIRGKDKIAVKILGQHFNEFYENAEDEYINSFINNINSLGIKCSTYISQTYPEKLKETYHFPIVLYLKGDLTLLKKRSVAIVGSRTPTSYGKSVTHDFSKALSRCDICIVSGLAMGVDRIAHQACLEVGGKTIAVLGSGFSHIYPAMNNNLAKEIENKGLLVSEYAPHIPPDKFKFPTRNRIIAGLSDGVLVTEAGEKSGALYTKEFALEFGRNVYAIPGNVNSIMSKGTNNIIKHMQGSVVLSYKDILTEMRIEDGNKKKVLQLDVNQTLIVSALSKESLHYDEISQITKLDAKTLNSCLTTLSIRGIIKKLPGNFYSI